MTPPWLTWLLWSIGGVLALAGLVLLISALFWDRSRGRLRCPKCWYDMSGLKVGDLTCPECGRTQKHEGRLRKTRRRYVRAAASVVLVGLGVGSALAPRIMQHDPLAIVPAFALRLILPEFEEDAIAQFSAVSGPANVQAGLVLGASAPAAALPTSKRETWEDHLAVWGAIQTLREPPIGRASYAMLSDRRSPRSPRMPWEGVRFRPYGSSSHADALDVLYNVGAEARVAQPELAAIIDDPGADPGLRAMALRASHEFGPRLRPRMRKLLHDTSVPVELRIYVLQLMRDAQWIRLGDADAVVGLLNSVPTPASRHQEYAHLALDVLLSLGEDAARPRIEAVLDSPDLPNLIRLDAAEALGVEGWLDQGLGARSLAQVLDGSERNEAVRAGELIAAHLHARVATSVLLNAMQSTNQDECCGAERGFLVLGPAAEEAVSDLEQCAMTHDPEIAAYSISSLMAIGPPALPAIERAFRAAEPKRLDAFGQRIMDVYQAAERRPILPMVTEALLDERRFSLHLYQCLIESRVGAAYLLPYLETAQPPRRARIQFLLAKVTGAQNRSAFVAALDDADPAVRALAVGSLKLHEHDHAQTLPTVIDLLERESDPFVRMECARLFTAWGIRSTRAAAALAQVATHEAARALRYTVLQALDRIAPHPVIIIDKSVAFLDDPYPPTRYLAATLLGEAGPETLSRQDAMQALRETVLRDTPEAEAAQRSLDKLLADAGATATIKEPR